VNKVKKPKSISPLNNIRYYVIIFWVLVGILIFLGLQVVVSPNNLRFLRLQQIFILLSVINWFLVLYITALSTVLKQSSFLKLIFYFRTTLILVTFGFAGLGLLIASLSQQDGTRIFLTSFILQLVLFISICLLFGLYAFNLGRGSKNKSLVGLIVWLTLVTGLIIFWQLLPDSKHDNLETPRDIPGGSLHAH
jgi:hypothetical protein